MHITPSKEENYKIKKCRICSSKKLYSFLSLGKMPIPNGFVTKDNLKKKEKYYPLSVSVCQNCWLVQLNHVIPAEEMFKNYLYIPSTSKTMLNHFKSMALDIISQYRLSSRDLVVDVGSNDGALLKFFKEQEIKVLGIDPATNLAKVAELQGIPTLCDFFSSSTAERLASQKKPAKVITATNVVAHIDKLHDFCEAVKILLTNDGVCIMEYPHLANLLQKIEFDTIYHEHLSYFSVLSLNKLFKTHSLEIIDIKRLPVHGGSIRVTVAKKNSGLKSNNSVQEFIKSELNQKLNTLFPYKKFAQQVKKIKIDLLQLLTKLKKNKKRIIGYGASAKGNVLLNYCAIDAKLLDYIVDSIPYKQGRYTPGTHIPIYSESRLEKDNPDYVLLLSWNFADEILQKQARYRERGGQFILTVPDVHLE